MLQMERVIWDDLEQTHKVVIFRGWDEAGVAEVAIVDGDLIVGRVTPSDASESRAELESWLHAHDSQVIDACRVARLYSPRGMHVFSLPEPEDDADADHCRGGCALCLLAAE